MYKAPLAAAIRSMRDLGACRDEITGHSTGISLLLSASAWVLLRTPDRAEERLERRVNVPVHGRCGERRSPKVQPSISPGIEPGIF